jgi:hypothetical protein
MELWNLGQGAQRERDREKERNKEWQQQLNFRKNMDM